MQRIIKDIDQKENSVNIIKDKYSWVFESLYDIYFEVSLDLNVTFLSQSFEKVSKYKMENVLGKDVQRFFRDTQKLNSIKEELLKNGAINNKEIQLIDSTGNHIDCIISLKLIYNKTHEPHKIIGIIHDITENKKTELLILESEKRYKTLVELSPNPIFVVQDKKFVFGNPATFTLLNCKDLDEINHLNPIEFVFQDDRNDFISYLRKITEGNEATPIELRIVNCQNEIINVLSHAIVIKFEGTPAYLFVIQEITKLKHFEKELIAAKAKAEESDRLKSSFLANMSHEIRTPLNGIIGFASLIRKPNISQEKLDTYTQIIQSASHQLLGLINDIIDISKIEAGQMAINRDKLNLNAIMDEMYSIYLNQVEKKGIQLVFSKSLENENAEIFSDETKIKQILNNLLNNALKFTEKGKISFSYSINKNFLNFTVSDTGIGIPKHSKDAVFERFRQLDINDNRRYGGTGLGLSICKALVEMMGGKIVVLDNEPIGTIFEFSLPYEPVKNLNNKKIKDFNKQAVPNWQGKTILIAEDEETNFYFLQEIIEETNASILYADNGKAAIEIFEQNPEINLVLLDIKMPELDGFKVLKQIKEHRPNIPVIAQTAYAMSNEKQKVFESGFNDYLSKPIDRNLFYKVVNTYLK